ncbi:MAG: DMT family transporter [Saprospiraceae bacterium]
MNKKIITLLVIFTMLFWAVNFHMAKIALKYYSPMAVAAIRFFFGVLVLFPIMWVQYKSPKLPARFSKTDWWYIFLTGFFGFFLTIHFFNKGLTTTSAINSSLIIATSTILTALLAFFWMGKKLVKLQWLAILISFLGVAIILVKGDLAQLLDLEIAEGDFYILMMAIVFSISQVLIEKNLSHVDSIVTTSFASLIALVLFILSSLPELISTEVPTDFSFWGSILFMGILGTGVAYAFFYKGVVVLGATKSSLYMNLIPLFTVLTAFPFGEIVTPIQLVGGGVIIFGLLIFGWSRRKKTASLSNDRSIVALPVRSQTDDKS